MMKIIDTRPLPFSQPETSIWTDPYVRKSLLAAHLDPDTDAASRKPAIIRETAEWIDGRTGRNSRVLDLGCGPGLYAELLAGKGHLVTGIDLNRTSLEYAEERNLKNRLGIRYIEGDYIRQFPGGTYDLALMIYCDMGTYSDADRDRLLANCRNALVPGGKLIFDVFDEGLAADKREGSSWEYCGTGGFWTGAEHLALKQTFHYPELRLFAYQYNILTAGETRYFLIWEHYYTEDEIVRILKEGGWNRVDITRNLSGRNDFTSDSVMFVTAEK